MINCPGLTKGLILTIGPNAKVGTSSTRVPEQGINVLASLGDQSIKVINSGTIYSDKRGININANTSRNDVSNNIELEHAGTIDTMQQGIAVAYSYIGGSVGIGVDDIIITTAEDSIIKSAGTYYRIYAHHYGKEGDIKITDDGSIDSDRISFYVRNHASSGNGNITITTGENSKIDAKDIRDGDAGINASVRDVTDDTAVGGSGSVTVTHKGTITAKVEGIFVSNRQTGTSGNTGDLTVTTEEGSMITADSDGIEADIQDSNASGEITITYSGTITGENAGINLGTYPLTVSKYQSCLMSSKTNSIIGFSSTKNQDPIITSIRRRSYHLTLDKCSDLCSNNCQMAQAP